MVLVVTFLQDRGLITRSDTSILGCASEHESVSGNFVSNPSFEDGTSGWTGSVTLSANSSIKNSGCASLFVTGRSAEYNGPGQDLSTGQFEVGQSYTAYAYVRADSGSARFKLTLRRNDSSTSYISLGTETANSSGWTRIQGTYTHSQSGTLSGMRLYVESADSNTANFYLDDVVMYKVDGSAWKTTANERIEQVRKRDLQIKVVNDSGTAVSGANVQITQTKNEFAFGTAINSNRLQNWQNGTPSSLNTYEQFVVDNFEWTVAESRHKWPAFEYSRDNVKYDEADKLVEFSKQNDLRMRGHALFWGVTYYDFDPPWVYGLSGSELQGEVYEHIDAIVPRYGDYIEHWDVNNEMTHGNIYGITLSAQMHKRVRERDSDVKLAVNDYHIISPRSYDNNTRLTRYINLVRDLRNNGAEVDILAVQGHFEDEVTPDPIDIYNRLDQLTNELGGTPIWVTEYDATFVNKNERADALERVYRTVFSHPNTEGILMWGFWDGQHWKDDAAIVDQDWTVNAAGLRYQALRDEWSTEASSTTNTSGVASFRGFHGEYDLRVTLPGGGVVNSDFTLSSDSDQALVITISSSGQQNSSSSSTSSASTSTSSATSSSGNPGTPYGGTAVALPGEIEAEHYNEGANGQAYYDADGRLTSGDFAGVTFRNSTDVDIKEDPNESDYIIGSFEETEWLQYTVDVAATGSYQLQAVTHSVYSGRQLNIYIDGQLEATINVPVVDAWTDQATSTAVDLDLTAGERVVRVEMAGGNYADLDKLIFAVDDQSASTCAPDYNGNGEVDVGDLSIFAQNYLASDIDCNLDLAGGDCRLNASDFSVFSSAYKINGYCESQ